MSAELHTPAPWTVHEDDDGWVVRWSGTEICVVYQDFDNDDAHYVARKASDLGLISAAPDLLALAHQYASECALCDGTGVRQDRGLDPRAGEPCERCADIWAVIDRAEGRA